MPTYEYRCPKCRHEFEKLQRMSEKPVSKCPKCGAKPERLIGAGAGLIFKGSGFYITDYKKSASGEKKDGAEKAAKKDAPKKDKE